MGHWRKQEISFFVTSKCNLRCKYCYMPNLNIAPPDQFIDLKFAVAGLRDFFTENTSRTIRFFSSGEATTAFDRMVAIWNEAKSLAGKDLKTELQTNGFFDDEVCSWVEQHVDIVWISCDGPPSIQDIYRPTEHGNASSETVLNNIRRLSQRHGMQFGVRATIAAKNFERQSELVQYFHDLGVRYICAAPTYHSEVNSSVRTPPLVEFAKNFVPAFNKARELGMFYQTHLMVNFDEPVTSYCRACTPCPHLTTDGFVSCCDWASFGPQYLPGPLQECIYGRYDLGAERIIYDNAQIERIRARNTEHLGKTACRGCPALENCAGGCIGKMIVETHDLYRATPEWCSAVRYLFSKLPINEGVYPCRHS